MALLQHVEEADNVVAFFFSIPFMLAGKSMSQFSAGLGSI